MEACLLVPPAVPVASQRHDLRLRDSRLAPGQAGRLGHHAPTVSVVYRGGGRVAAPQAPPASPGLTLRAGSVLLAPARAVCTFRAGAAGLGWVTWAVEGSLGASSPLTELLADQRLVRSDRAIALAHQARAELQRPDAVSAWQVRGLLLQLLALLGRAPRDPGPCDQPPAWMDELLARLRGALREHPSVESLASGIGVLPRELATAFRQHHRCTLIDFLRRQRLQVAMQLLAETELPLAAVAVEAGFYDQSHLTNLLKRETGLTPRAFRRTTRTEPPAAARGRST